MKKRIHLFLTIDIMLLALIISIGNTCAVNMRWVTAVYWFLIAIRVCLELPHKPTG